MICKLIHVFLHKPRFLFEIVFLITLILLIVECELQQIQPVNGM